MSFHYKKKIAEWKWFDEQTVTSTNDIIKELSKEEYPVVVSAVEQTAGRGRRNRKWVSKTGNLYFTLSLEIKPQEISRYVCLIGLVLAKTITEISPLCQPKIKWPNDIFLKDKKLTGMLLENIKEDIWAVGIGVNIADSPKLINQAYEATSLKENGILTTREIFLEKFLNNLSKMQKQYRQQGFTPIKDEWLKQALNLGKEIIIKNEKDEKRGKFLTLDENGYLILKTNQGKQKIIAGDLFLTKEK